MKYFVRYCIKVECNNGTHNIITLKHQCNVQKITVLNKTNSLTGFSDNASLIRRINELAFMFLYKLEGYATYIWCRRCRIALTGILYISDQQKSKGIPVCDNETTLSYSYTYYITSTLFCIDDRQFWRQRIKRISHKEGNTRKCIRCLLLQIFQTAGSDWTHTIRNETTSSTEREPAQPH